MNVHRVVHLDAATGAGKHADRFRPERPARMVNVVAGQVEHRAAAALGVVAPVRLRGTGRLRAAGAERAAYGVRLADPPGVDQLACLQMQGVMAELERLHNRGAAVVRCGDQALRPPCGLGERLFAQDGAHPSGAGQPFSHLGVERSPGADNGDVDLLALQHPVQVEVTGGRFRELLAKAVERRLRHVAHGGQVGAVGESAGAGVRARNAAGSHERDAIVGVGHGR